MKQIAVILGAINLDNQKKLLQGMQAAAKEQNCNLYVFTNYVGTRETVESVIAANRVLKLPDFSKFDGAIFVGNTVHHPEAVKRVVEELQQSKTPTVSVDREFEGMSCVTIYSYDAEYEMVEHFVQHGYKNMCYVSGFLEVSSEARLRAQAYRDVMQKHGLPFSEDDIYEGGFTLVSGADAAKRMLADGKRPEAIVCGNDDMALGVIEVFQKAGYRFPEDIKIAGFDNVELSRLNKPTLSTVDKNQFEVGYKSLYEVLELIKGKAPEKHVVPCKPIYRESCGCKQQESTVETLETAMGDIKGKFIEQQHDTLRMCDMLRSMTDEFAKAHTLEDLLHVLKGYIPDLDLNKFYLCLCEKEKVFALPERNLGQNIDILQTSEEYTDMIEIPVAYENGEFKSYPQFERGMVLPEVCRTQSGGNVFVVNQLFYQNSCYGYAISENTMVESQESVIDSGLYHSWLMQIEVGFEHVRKWMLLKDAVDKLNGMWCYDNMTHLYNRSGFYNEAKCILDNLKAEDKWAFIIFMDADGLKTVNDTIGHEAGDRMIQAIAKIVHENTQEGMLAMRYGGDEFVLFGGFAPGEHAIVEELAEGIRQGVRDANASGEYEFTLSVSMGGSGWRAQEIEDLSGLIEQADQQMYEEKRKKKMR